MDHDTPDIGAQDLDIETLMVLLPVPALFVDDARRLLSANELAYDILSPLKRERDLTHTVRNPALIDAFAAVLKNGAPMKLEVVLASRGGKSFEVSLTRLITQNAHGVLMTFYETTAVRRAEHQQSTFVADVSHELRSPLTTLIGALGTLRGSAGDDAALRGRFIDIMDAETQRMNRLIDDLLVLSATEVQEHITPTDSVALAPVIERTIDRVTDKAKARGIEINLDMSDPECSVRGEQDQLFQILQNLCENAIKYGAENRPIYIKADKADPEILGRDDAISISVINSGNPIPAAHIPRLTDRFYRVEESRARDVGGTGLGLAIVKHIVSRHKGRLIIKSDEQNGTRFTVVLPQ